MSRKVSIAPYAMSNSLFTAVVLDGPRGEVGDRGGGSIGVFDPFNYVAAELPKLGSQHPIFKAEQLEENFAIAGKPTSLSPDQAIKTAPVSGPSKSKRCFAPCTRLDPYRSKSGSAPGATHRACSGPEAAPHNDTTHYA